MAILNFYVLDPAGNSGNGDFDGFGGAPISIDSIDDFLDDADLTGTALAGGTVGGVATVTLEGVELQLAQVFFGGEEYYADIGGFDLESLGTISGLIGTLDGASFSQGSGVAVCFARGAMIRTEFGLRAIEDLLVGDRVLTMDHGPQAIRWIGSNSVATSGALAPVRIKAGALEHGPSEDLLVSPKHRVLVSGWQAKLLFGEGEVLVTSEDLVNDCTIVRDRSARSVEYFHILFDRHELIWANDMLSESFHPSDAALSNVTQATRDELFEIFSDLGVDGETGVPLARPTVSTLAASTLAASTLNAVADDI